MRAHDIAMLIKGHTKTEDRVTLISHALRVMQTTPADSQFFTGLMTIVSELPAEEQQRVFIDPLFAYGESMLKDESVPVKDRDMTTALGTLTFDKRMPDAIRPQYMQRYFDFVVSAHKEGLKTASQLALNMNGIIEKVPASQRERRFDFVQRAMLVIEDTVEQGTADVAGAARRLERLLGYVPAEYAAPVQQGIRELSPRQVEIVSGIADRFVPRAVSHDELNGVTILANRFALAKGAVFTGYSGRNVNLSAPFDPKTGVLSVFCANAAPCLKQGSYVVLSDMAGSPEAVRDQVARLQSDAREQYLEFLQPYAAA